MANELIISNGDDGLRIAILENKRLVELHHEKRNNLFQVGDVFLGRVTRVLPPLNAVFVDIGHSRDGFLHYFDLGPQIRSQSKYLSSAQQQKKLIPLNEFKGLPDIDKHGKMADVLKVNQPVLVQIMKEAISTKGPRLSSQLSIPGQYIILMPFSSDVSVSRKFTSNEEKKRIRQLLEGICPANVGIIVRTAAEGVEFEKLKNEFDGLMAKWDKLSQELMGSAPPLKVLSEMDRTTSILRDMLSIGFEAIYTDDQEVYNDLGAYLQQNLPEQRRILNLKKTRTDLFEHLGIEKQIKSSFGKNVNMSNGSYLVIEHTEALHVVDVNSGSQRSQNSPEENALAINLEACSEIARQLRLRDMGGIIVVDFIDQKNMENRRRVSSALQMEMSKDRARHTILPMSRFGLIQITRQRVRPEVSIVTEEVCPSCNGTGKIGPTLLLADQIETNIDYLIRKGKVNQLTLAAHPFVISYYREGWPSRRQKWWWKYKKWVKLDAQSSLPLTTVKYLDEHGEEIKLD
jgi:ribonuclease G